MSLVTLRREPDDDGDNSVHLVVRCGGDFVASWHDRPELTSDQIYLIQNMLNAACRRGEQNAQAAMRQALGLQS